MKGLFIMIFCALATVMRASSVLYDETVFPIEFSQTTELKCTNLHPVSSVTFSGRIQLHSPEAVARVVLVDTKGNRYLVTEMVAQYCAAKDSVQTKVGLETTVLPVDVVPACIKVALNKATVCVEAIELSQNDLPKEQRELLLKKQKDAYAQREQSIVDYINTFNEENHIYWRASKKHWANMSYMQKMQSLGMSDEDVNWGYEYYDGGLLVLGATNYASLSPAENSQYVSEFDWRNRHGQNWLTPIRDQRYHEMIDGSDTILDSKCCWAFAAVATAEARINLYFNRHIDLDLSEEYVIAYCRSHSSNPPYWNGDPNDALRYMVQHGVIDENSCPFGTHWDYTIPASSIPSQELVSFENYHSFGYQSFDEDLFKSCIIQNGPIAATVQWTTGTHAMALVGYKVLELGDTISWYGETAVSTGRHIVDETDGIVGSTCWIFKNSYGTPSDQRDDGYLYAVMPSPRNIFKMLHSGMLIGNVVTCNYTDNNIVVEDADGDGYYNWGIGPKPAGLPSTIPDQPDSNDADGDIGPMDEYGFPIAVTHCESDTIYIWRNTTWSNERWVNYQLVVKPGATLRITSPVAMSNNAHIFVEAGAGLVVDGTTISNADIVPRSGASLRLHNAATIQKKPQTEFTVPIGTQLLLEQGTIQ